MEFSKLSRFFVFLLCLCLQSFLQANIINNKVKNYTFGIDYERNTFLKDGKPFRYVSGSMHYFRTPKYYWMDRLEKMYAAGLNVVQTYVAWNYHEPLPGVFRFSGDQDLVGFIKTAQEVGLLVILRPGPYIDAEWEFGGFPGWLLNSTKKMRLRSMDPEYIQHVDKWFDILLPMLKPLLYENGGPILMLQVENEYGSYFECDHDYIRHLEHKFRDHLGPNVILFSTDGDGDSYMKCGSLQGLYATCDFGVTMNPAKNFKVQRDFEPKGPLVNSEFYTGWLDNWGLKHHTVNAVKFAASLDLILKLGANVNMYMFEGGSNFGFWNGANYPPFHPNPTSYDYDAPLTEAGDLTEKYYLIQNVISKYHHLPKKSVSASVPKGSYGGAFLKKGASILDLLPEFQRTISKYPIFMEDLGLYFGFTLYRHKLKASVVNASLVGRDVRDRGYVFVDEEKMGVFKMQETYVVNITGKAGQYLNILIENQGHITFGNTINKNFKGILLNLTIDKKNLTDWEMYPFYNLQSPDLALQTSFLKKAMTISSQFSSLKLPSFYYGFFNLSPDEDKIYDTFIDMKDWTKGQVFINYHNVGRYWPKKGPQVRLYVPRTVLKPGLNTVILFELEEAPCCSACPCLARFMDQPLINGTVTEK